MLFTVCSVAALERPNCQSSRPCLLGRQSSRGSCLLVVLEASDEAALLKTSRGCLMCGPRIRWAVLSSLALVLFTLLWTHPPIHATLMPQNFFGEDCDRLGEWPSYKPGPPGFKEDPVRGLPLLLLLFPLRTIMLSLPFPRALFLVQLPLSTGGTFR